MLYDRCEFDDLKDAKAPLGDTRKRASLLVVMSRYLLKITRFAR